MADVFLSYARADVAQVTPLSAGIEESGRSLWWDRRLPRGGDYALEIERELDAAACVVVAWSGAARESLWVRAEANVALDQGKLVQVNLDRARLPLPFTMLHFIDFADWPGSREQAPWPSLEREVDQRVGDNPSLQSGRRPVPGGIPVSVSRESALQGFGRVAALGWAALATAIILALSILLVARDLISASAFGIVSVAALASSALLLAASAWMLLRTEKASRR